MAATWDLEEDSSASKDSNSENEQVGLMADTSEVNSYTQSNSDSESVDSENCDLSKDDLIKALDELFVNYKRLSKEKFELQKSFDSLKDEKKVWIKI